MIFWCLFTWWEFIYQNCFIYSWIGKHLAVSWWSSLLYRNQSIDLLCKSMDWFLYDRGLRHERVKSLHVLKQVRGIIISFDKNSLQRQFKDVIYSRKKVNFRYLTGSRTCLCITVLKITDTLQILKFKWSYVKMGDE